MVDVMRTMKQTEVASGAWVVIVGGVSKKASCSNIKRGNNHQKKPARQRSWGVSQDKQKPCSGNESVHC